MTDGDRYDPTGTDAALPTVDSGWPEEYNPSDDSPHLTETLGARGHGLGLFALVLAVLVISGTVIVSIVLGITGGQYATNLLPDGYTYDLGGDSSGIQALAAETAWQYVIGTALGVWAIVQGIVAIAKNRGRLFGVLAILVAVPGPVVTLLVTVITVGQHLPR
jgi:hypothetical protein